MKEAFKRFLQTSYTAYHAAENCANMLEEAGFSRLAENGRFDLREGGKYYLLRGGAIVAFVYRKEAGFSVVASHTDSPCLKLKENPALSDERFTRLNCEPYGGGLWYTFFDRPLRIAGRIVTAQGNTLRASLYESPFRTVLPSLAIHMNRDANEKFAPDLQKDLPLLSLGKCDLAAVLEGALSFDLFAVPDEAPFESGASGEFLSASRIDNLSSVFASISALKEADCKRTCVVAALDSEEIGSRTHDGAGSGFLRSVLLRIAEAQGLTPSETEAAYADSFLLSVDNAHAVHPNHPEKCDPTNRPVLGGGIVLKGHAGGAYTTDAMTSAVVKTVLGRAGVKFQTFYNRSDLRSGSTLGAISLGQISLPSADIGLAQLAMHSAVETMAHSDLEALTAGLTAFFDRSTRATKEGVVVE